ncbi:MAG TPA: peptidase T, partial [Pirellulales bacterium]|nr:peptidase T [Pirellulales bacterium]
MNQERLLERFLRYVRIDTTAGDGSAGYPSSPGQLVLGRLLVEELLAIGLNDAEQDEHGIVMATLSPTCKRPAPVIAFNAHVDTSPETTGANVKPQVCRNYQGGDLPLAGDPSQVIRVEENPELRQLIGRTIITTDGTTLLGADDKAGIAAIMEAVAYLAEHSELEHGAIRVCFTCDEEIGHGVDHVDLNKLGATACYTLDGSGVDLIDVETFSADLATVTVRGVNIHPSIAKGRMVNAVRVAADFLSRLPREMLSPETTADRQGFLHPYKLEGGVAQVTIAILLRDFDTARLADHAHTLRAAAQAASAAWPGSAIDVDILTQYRNMAEGLAREPRAVAYAQEASRRLGREPRLSVIRGGTDGSRFTELGLPTPNLSTGEHNPHSPLEWTCLEEMAQAAEVLVELAQVWAKP